MRVVRRHGETIMDIDFTQKVVFGSMHPNEDSTIIFINRAKCIRRTIVDRTGVIVGFPGVEGLENISPQICFRTSIETVPSGRFYMLWEVNPDGRFYSDESGFGMESGEKLRLYAFIDDEGRFEDSFRIYNRGSDSYIDPNKM